MKSPGAKEKSLIWLVIWVSLCDALLGIAAADFGLAVSIFELTGAFELTAVDVLFVGFLVFLSSALDSDDEVFLFLAGRPVQIIQHRELNLFIYGLFIMCKLENTGQGLKID